MWWKLILTALTSAPAERIVAMILDVLVKRMEAAKAKDPSAANGDVVKNSKALEKIYKASTVAYSLTTSGAALIQKMQAVDPEHTTTEVQYAEIGKAALECWAQAKSTPEEFVKLWKKPDTPLVTAPVPAP